MGGKGREGEGRKGEGRKGKGNVCFHAISTFQS